MTLTIPIALKRVSFALPDGRRLFSDIDLVLDSRRTGLVGRNGVGKSVLARVVAGDLPPTSGRRIAAAPVFYLPQQLADVPGATVADLAGIGDALAALARIEAGSVDAGDFAQLGDRWDLRQRLRALLDRHGLGHLASERPAARLSGGEHTRVALLGAWLSDARYLVLDEPTNHLDRDQRAALLLQLSQWPGGMLLVSHDRALLHIAERMLELEAGTLHDHAGGYADYVGASTARRRQAAAELAQRKLERRRGEVEARAARERLDRRAARGAREARAANQAPILLGLQRQRSEASGGQRRRQQAERLAVLDERVTQAAQQVVDDAPVVLLTPVPQANRARRVALLDGVVLAHGVGGGLPLDLIVTGQQRIAVTGANGSGKSTLLRTLAGELAPQAGRCVVSAALAHVDQTLVLLKRDRAVLTQLAACYPAAGEATLRTRLALLGLDAAAVQRPARELSGGEQLKAALALALCAERPCELLLLDEPTNHLDLASLQALERMLLAYRGALVVVSHDTAFLAALSLHTRIEPGRDGWSVVPWQDPAESPQAPVVTRHSPGFGVSAQASESSQAAHVADPMRPA